MPSPLDEPETSIPPQMPELTGAAPPESTTTPQPLAIDYPSSNPSLPVEHEEEEQVHKLDLGGGNVVKLDKLGPMIVNTDGTLSRIQNWHELGEIERERTVRLLVKKRNLVRLEKRNEEERAAGRTEGEELTALKKAQQEGA